VPAHPGGRVAPSADHPADEPGLVVVVAHEPQGGTGSVAVATTRRTDPSLLRGRVRTDPGPTHAVALTLCPLRIGSALVPDPCVLPFELLATLFRISVPDLSLGVAILTLNLSQLLRILARASLSRLGSGLTLFGLRVGVSFCSRLLWVGTVPTTRRL